MSTPGDELSAAIWPGDRPGPSRTIRCRHCGRRNRVQVPTALEVPERHRCGCCDALLFVGPHEPLYGLSCEAYQHGLDRRAVAALRGIPGLPGLIRSALAAVGDRSARLAFMSDAIQCGDDQFPELVALMERARTNLDFPTRPTVFLGEGPHMNAMTTGVSEPIIVVRSALLDQMGDDEIVAVLGHELGHLHAEHPLYHSIARLLVQGGTTASELIRVLSLPIQRMLLRWTRCAELTADRAALLASRDLGSVVGVMLTFAGGNRPGTSGRTRMKMAPFIRQCRELAQLQSERSMDRFLGNMLSVDRTHPHVAWRVMHLIQWIEHGNYLEILAGHYPRRSDDASARALEVAP